jgi:hypothetical protein
MLEYPQAPTHERVSGFCEITVTDINVRIDWLEL